MQVESGKTYVGVVEDNNDPKKMGRVKVRVLDVFDNTPLENIPWANPWKDLSGDEFLLPDKGKIVTVVFENANINNPEFIFSDHYNANLEKKLTQLSESDYLSMKSLIFDHKTQIYVNDSEGLKLDHKFNLINIKDKTIDVALKDNFGKINLGTANSTQRSILGDNFLNWFDDFVQILMGSKGGPFLGNLGAPVVATPALLGSLQLYQQLKDPKFLSKNVYIVDNENVAKLDRIAEGQKGDTWQSTVKDNEITSKEPVPFKPTDGATDTTFDQPQENAPISPTQSVQPPDPKPAPAENPDVAIILQILQNKKYKLYQGVYEVNIIAVRNQCLAIGDKYTDTFCDKIYIMFKKPDETWEIKHYMFSTVPGLKFTLTENWIKSKNIPQLKDKVGKSIFMKDYLREVYALGDRKVSVGLTILVPSQYIDSYYISTYFGDRSLSVINGAKQLIWSDNNYTEVDKFYPRNFTSPTFLTQNSFSDYGLKIHRGYPGGKSVGQWSMGSQVFSSAADLKEFFSFCDKHKDKYGNKFTYTLVTKNDWDEAVKNVEANKSSDSLSATQSQTTTTTTNTTTTGTSGTSGVSGTASASGAAGTTAGATSSQSTTQNTNTQSGPTQYIIGILNATSEIAKKVTGNINISKNGTDNVAIGNISGLPDGKTIGPITGQPSNTTSYDSLVEELISKLEDAIFSQYNIPVKLVVLDKK